MEMYPAAYLPLQKMTNVQLCFLLDCTASMQVWIDAARDEIYSILAETRQEYSDADFEVAFVGYRDYGDTVQHIVYPFTRDIEDMRIKISHTDAIGGWDTAEDVAGGLERAVGLFSNTPRTGVRHIVHILDAPPHGAQFHGSRVRDRYPNGDPNGNDPLRWIREMCRKTIDYTIVKVDDCIDTMVDVFHNSYMSNDSSFRVLDLRPRRRSFGDGTTMTLTPMVSRALNESIMHWSSSQDPRVE